MASSSSASGMSQSYLGLHRDAIAELKREWDLFQLGDHCKTGSKVFQALLDRDAEFILCDSFFNVSDYGIKIHPYPKTQPVPTIADALKDVLRYKGDNHVKLIALHNGRISKKHCEGPEIVDKIIAYLASKSEKDYKSVVYPLTLPVYRLENQSIPIGIGKVNLKSLIPPEFRQSEHIFHIDREDWTTALVPKPSLDFMHFNHILCGQIMPHFFGKKIWIMCPHTPLNMSIWCHVTDKSDSGRMLDMIKQSDQLVVYVATNPCIMVLPPHTFHTALTFELACHSEIRVSSDIWIENIKESITVYTNEHFVERLREDPHGLNQIMQLIVPDLLAWATWCETIKRKPTEREWAIMDTLVPAVKTYEGFLDSLPIVEGKIACYTSDNQEKTPVKPPIEATVKNISKPVTKPRGIKSTPVHVSNSTDEPNSGEKLKPRWESLPPRLRRIYEAYTRHTGAKIPLGGPLLVSGPSYGNEINSAYR
ncbi:hypothetical protein BDN70DRAFT_935262 [Pholiota conissans]|uniref:Uncharacterized protein n=1 Tax=Pholiota conissans TaxID=109636 RepID=A0A9P5YWU4_9AGAR|nr:hypothetical protein BDN70DRAFT_935262 [Pholiota conissans]